jgi:hypothetical protein
MSSGIPFLGRFGPWPPARFLIQATKTAPEEHRGAPRTAAALKLAHRWAATSRSARDAGVGFLYFKLRANSGLRIIC